ISYNILNLPQTITVANKGTISYLYDAAGNKLSKTVNETGQAAKTTQYVGGLIFEGNVLQHVGTEEGRVRLESGQWRYDYFLKDNLGNVRVMLADNATPLEETHYYPFGLTQRGISTRQTGNLHNKEKTFQDQQIDEDLDLNWVQFKWRNHDPQIGRFIEVDPLSEDYVHNSTYAFSENKVVAHIELEGLESIPFPLPVPFPFLPPQPIRDPTNGKLDEVATKTTEGFLRAFVVPLAEAVVKVINRMASESSDDNGGNSSGSNETSKTQAQQRAEKLSQKPREGQDFTKAGKDAVIELNKEKNSGKTVCESCKTETKPAKKSEKGVTPPKDETQVDHIQRRREGGSGTPNNGQVLCRGCNLKKH
ncbi:MAG TPA: RHS repeat-associated core domain-containing protein, partial [Niabella sp.]|nr:RHS repeat-associated core domain-containing protein [Niabella sp.]